jgi:predicted DNA-binding transcriptional regulator AlpA
MTEKLKEASELIKDSTREKLGLMTPEELALALQVTVTTLQTWRVQDQGPRYVKLGKGVFYRYRDVEAWFEDCLSPLQGAQSAQEQTPSTTEAVA